MPRKKNKEYYAVLEGHRLAQPIIYSSWAKAHVRTSGYKTESEIYFKGFHTLEEAETMLKKHGRHYTLDIKSKTEQTTPEKGTRAYYAVANGRKPGIYPYFCSVGGAEPQVDKEPHSCHKRFRTEEQAKSFIEDWCNSYLDILREVTAEQLKAGWRPSFSHLALDSTNLLPPTNIQDANPRELVDPLKNMTI